MLGHAPLPRARAGVPILVLLAALCLLAVPAAAHAVLQSSQPAQGSRLDTAPSLVSVQLTEPVDPAGTGLEVLDQDDIVWHDGATLVTGDAEPTLTVALRPDVPDGAYRIVWRALSTADGHTTSGQVGFAVGDHEPPGATASETGSANPGNVIARAVGYAGLAVVFGALAFLLRVDPGRHAWRIALAAGAALHAAGALLLAVSSRAATGLAWSAFLASDVGQVLALRVLAGVTLLLLAFVALRRRATLPAVVAGLLGLASVVLAARHSHASLAGLPGILVDTLHLVAGATWAGGLVLLAWLVARAPQLGVVPEGLAVVARRFGTIAMACVIVLLMAGVGSTLAILGPSLWQEPGALLRTTWGKALAVKVALLAGMLALALRNRRALANVAAHPAPTARRTVALEAGLGLLVLLVAGVLTAVSPSVAQEDSLRVEGHGQSFLVVATLEPRPVTGVATDLALRITDHVGGNAVETDTCGRTGCVQVRIYGAAGNGTDAATFSATPRDGRWVVEDILWTRPGSHVVEVRVQTDYVYLDVIRMHVDVA